MPKNIFFILFILSASLIAQIISPKAVVKLTEYNFGNIEPGQIVNYSFVITNTGGDVLKIQDVRATCGCTAAKPEKSEISPGESASIKVTFNSTGRMGNQQKYVYVTTNDPANSLITLKIFGNIIPHKESEADKKSAKLFMPETEFYFGNVNEGKIVSHVFKLLNKGNATLEVKEVKTSCGCTAALVSDKRIEPGKDGTLKVDLDTKNRSGKLSRTVTIISNDPNEPQKVIVLSADIIKANK